MDRQNIFAMNLKKKLIEFIPCKAVKPPRHKGCRRVGRRNIAKEQEQKKSNQADIK